VSLTEHLARSFNADEAWAKKSQVKIPVRQPPFGGHPAVWSQTWIGGVLEFFGGLLVMIGLPTRPVAFILCGMMAVAYFQFHHKMEAFWQIHYGGESAVHYCFIFLVVCAYGGGAWSIDALSRRKRVAHPVAL